MVLENETFRIFLQKGKANNKNKSQFLYPRESKLVIGSLEEKMFSFPMPDVPEMLLKVYMVIFMNKIKCNSTSHIARQVYVQRILVFSKVGIKKGVRGGIMSGRKGLKQ